jgi:N6-adenosine-specific RNA methylase IME4
VTEFRLEVPEEIKFGTVYADPPWALDKPGTEFRRRRLHYDRMSADAIKEIPVADFTTEDAHLWLWTTNTHLKLALDVVDAWGFEYKTLATWRKSKVGTGWWLRSRTEHLILAAKSTKLRHNPGSFTTEIVGDYRGHSVKPSSAYEMIERLSPGPYLELFSRNVPERKGWAHVGSDGVPADAFGQMKRHERSWKGAVKLDQSDGIVRGVGGLEIHADTSYTRLRKQLIAVPVIAHAQKGRRVQITEDGKKRWVSIDSLRPADYKVEA